jgi:hypothetical protein
MMMLPEATLSFTIPSIHDDTVLDCRIYHPKNFGSDGLVIKRSAVIAHPYAPMGGCYDDPVVAIVGATMLEHGFVLATFNFRCDLLGIQPSVTRLTALFVEVLEAQKAERAGPERQSSQIISPL